MAALPAGEGDERGRSLWLFSEMWGRWMVKDAERGRERDGEMMGRAML
jgi:hypothetical protein